MSVVTINLTKGVDSERNFSIFLTSKQFLGIVFVTNQALPINAQMGLRG